MLVDYRPSQTSRVPVPNQRVVKVLNGKAGKEIWGKYTEFQKKRQKFPGTMMTPQPSYMG